MSQIKLDGCGVQIPRSEYIQSVFPISVDKQSVGSCLAYVGGGVLYLITARHVIAKMAPAIKSTVYLFKNNEWLPIAAVPYFTPGSISHEPDIAILRTELPTDCNQSPNIELSWEGAISGQDVYFLGFPYFGQTIDHSASMINNGFPLPFVKKATLSAFTPPRIYLDCHNNPGFSGGPIIFWDYNLRKHKVLGFISGYITQAGQVSHVETSSELFYIENSGIAVGYSSQCVIDLIKKIND